MVVHETQCLKCGAPLTSESKDGVCPKCLLARALVGADETEGGRSTVAGLRIGYIGDYELLEEIARGGMGIVFKARQMSLNRLVALKMILSGERATEAEVRRFRQEAEAAAKLDHPNIVAIYEVGHYEGQHYFSMRLVEGINLMGTAQHAEGRMQHEEAAKLVATVARAVHYAHQRGILHRDLKPGNILIDAQGEPHVTDFGLAKWSHSPSSLTLSGSVMGTPGFMAPEQAAGQSGQITSAADIYSLGAVLYFLLTGRPPFEGQTPLEIMRKVVEEDPIRPALIARGRRGEREGKSAIDRDLETVCLKCLEKEPRRRYSSSEALAEDLGHWLQREPISARRSGPVHRLGKWGKRKPAMAGLTIALILATAIGMWKWREAHRRAAVAEQAMLDARKAKDRQRQLLEASDAFLVQQAADETNVDEARQVLESLEQALAREPGNPELWNAKGVLLGKTGKLDEGYAALSKAIAMAATNRPSVFAKALMNRCDLLKRLDRFGEAGLDYRRAKGLPLPGPPGKPLPVEMLPDYHLASSVSVQLGTTNLEAGLRQLEWGDGITAPAVLGDQTCRAAELSEGEKAAYIYFAIDPTFKWDRSETLEIQVEYYASSPFTIHYDGHPGAYESTTPVHPRPPPRWERATFRITNWRFENSQNGEADFRLSAGREQLAVRRVTVSDPKQYQPNPTNALDILPRPLLTPSNLIDLSPFYRRDLNWEMWRHWGVVADLAPDRKAAQALAAEVRQRTGVHFDLRGLICLYGSSLVKYDHMSPYPQRVAGIQVNQRFTKLHFLLMADYQEPEGVRIAYCVLHYPDGQTEELPFRYGENVRGDPDYRKTTRASVAWSGKVVRPSRPHRERRIYHATYENPRPELEVTTVDLVSTKSRCSLTVFALTVE